MEHPLTRYRKKHAVSKAEVARLAGTTRQTIHRIETGAQVPSLSLVGRIITATGDRVSAADFLPQMQEGQAA